jgi:hypothetical protein
MNAVRVAVLRMEQGTHAKPMHLQNDIRIRLRNARETRLKTVFSRDGHNPYGDVRCNISERAN